MAFHVFTPKISEWNKHFSYNVSPVCLKVLDTRSYNNNPPDILKKTSVGPSKNIDEKEKKNKYKSICKAFCVTRKRNKKIFHTPVQNSFNVLYYKRDITSITLLMNRLTFYSRSY